MKKKKRFALGLLVGRFQGVHSGHEMMIDTALAICDEVGIFIGSSEESGTAKNPFTYETRREMLRRIYGDKVKIYPLPDIGVGNCAAWGEYVARQAEKCFGKLPDVAISGKEERRASWLEGDAGERIAELYIPKTIEMSASTMREFFVRDECETWKKYTDKKLWDMYDELRAAVLASKDNLETKSL